MERLYRSTRAVWIIPPTPYKVTLAAALFGTRCVSARRGWAGEKQNFLSILLGQLPEELQLTEMVKFVAHV